MGVRLSPYSLFSTYILQATFVTIRRGSCGTNRPAVVHQSMAKIISTKIKVVKGHDSRDVDENFFLTDSDRSKLVKMSGEMEERAVVTSRAFDANGKQVGGKHPHELIRKGGDAGRWYVEDYAARF